MHKQHTEPGPSCCAPLRRPTCQQSDAIGATKQECSPSNANTLGQSTMWRGHTRSTTNPNKGKRRGCISKEFCAKLTCVPLHHLVLPLSGCACSGTPTKATRGDARGHPWWRLRRYQGCPLAKPATRNQRWPNEGKGITIGWAVGVIMNHWGVSSCCINPPVAMAHHRNDANTPRNTTKSCPHLPKPPDPRG